MPALHGCLRKNGTAPSPGLPVSPQGIGAVILRKAGICCSSAESAFRLELHCLPQRSCKHRPYNTFTEGAWWFWSRFLWQGNTVFIELLGKGEIQDRVKLFKRILLYMEESPALGSSNNTMFCPSVFSNQQVLIFYKCSVCVNTLWPQQSGNRSLCC